MEFDYIIVGAGSAGCALANRLSEDPDVMVLLLEAGGSDRHLNVTIPAAFAELFETERDWNYATTAQEHLADRELYWPRGKMLGGSSSMNAMIYIRGNRADYDGWAAAGNRGWGYDDVLPYFRKAEDNQRGGDHYHGEGGPLRVEDPRSLNPLTEAYLEAAVEAGIPHNDDFNGATQEGSGAYQVTQRRGARWSAAMSYLRPAKKRPNLVVRTGAHVTRVLFDGTRAIGVEAWYEHKLRWVRADREVVLAAGAIGSPQQLMLSGVGRADDLRKLGIDVVTDLPGVGENLIDHPSAPVIHMTDEAVSLMGADSPASLARWATTRTGPLTSNVGEGGAFVHTRDGLDGPDIQFHFAPVFFLDSGRVEPPGHAFTFGVTLLQPQSVGRIRLRSTEPMTHPDIDANYLSEPGDLDTIMAGIDLALEVADAVPLKGLATSRYLPRADDRDGMIAETRRNIQTLYHPVGTCRMGSGDEAVVDDQLRVRGLEGLRVVDASVMPTIPRGNTNAPTIMIAERAADLMTGATTV